MHVCLQFSDPSRNRSAFVLCEYWYFYSRIRESVPSDTSYQNVVFKNFGRFARKRLFSKVARQTFEQPLYRTPAIDTFELKQFGCREDVKAATLAIVILVCLLLTLKNNSPPRMFKYSFVISCLVLDILSQRIYFVNSIIF